MNPNEGMGLYGLELLDKMGKNVLANATDDLERIENCTYKL